MTEAHSEPDRLRAFWNGRYREFSLSEAGWLGAGDSLNRYLYRCKTQALQRALDAAGWHESAAFSVLDAGCGQGHFARFYGERYPNARYTGIDISERAVTHLRRTLTGAEFHLADLCQWADRGGRAFDVIQSFEVLHLILDDDLVKRAVSNLARQLGQRGSLIFTAARPDETVQPNDYLRYRGRRFWDDLLNDSGLRIADERPMYYWLPAGGPANRYLRYAFARLGPGALYVADRTALACRFPRAANEPPDCRMRLLTVQPR